MPTQSGRYSAGPILTNALGASIGQIETDKFAQVLRCFEFDNLCLGSPVCPSFPPLWYDSPCDNQEDIFRQSLR